MGEEGGDWGTNGRSSRLEGSELPDRSAAVSTRTPVPCGCSPCPITRAGSYLAVAALGLVPHGDERVV